MGWGEPSDARRAPVWQLGDGWHFGVKIVPFPCRSDVASRLRLRCGYSLDLMPDPERVAFRFGPLPVDPNEGDLPPEFGELPWRSLADILLAPGEASIWLPAGAVYLEFRVLQPDYRSEPWHISWRLVVA